MKISIIFGVIHMLFGVVIGLWNHMYFKRKLNITCEFIPQIIFLVFLFLYMVLLMFIKWIKYGPDSDKIDPEHGPSCAPSVLITFINMVLFKPGTAPKPCSPWMYGGQSGFQSFLVVIAVLCIPWMLLAKPIMLMNNRKKQHYQLNNHGTENGDVEGAVDAIQPANGVPQGGGHKEEEEDMAEVFIHQGIHTIEYVLGSVSHTASYLRLWALSLAHAQLSEVLWNMVMRNGLTQEGWAGGIILWAVFAFWAVLTVGILVLMEGLSAFLHTLRLHWVEFQSKFYSGLGYGFQPFSFEIILDAAQSTAED